MTAWGLLSTARINRLALAGARSSDHVDVIAVASRDRARAETYAREQSIEHAYESYDALLPDPAVEAVYISLSNSMHVEWTVRALAARKQSVVVTEVARCRHRSARTSVAKPRSTQRSCELDARSVEPASC
jgi:predicted dehydrogenase